jgi:hypothetical protein
MTQFVAAIRRRLEPARHWPLLLAGGGSRVFGTAALAMSGADDPNLKMIGAGDLSPA